MKKRWDEEWLEADDGVRFDIGGNGAEGSCMTKATIERVAQKTLRSQG